MVQSFWVRFVKCTFILDTKAYFIKFGVCIKDWIQLYDMARELLYEAKMKSCSIWMVVSLNSFCNLSLAPLLPTNSSVFDGQ